MGKPLRGPTLGAGKTGSVVGDRGGVRCRRPVGNLCCSSRKRGAHVPVRSAPPPSACYEARPRRRTAGACNASGPRGPPPAGESPWWRNQAGGSAGAAMSKGLIGKKIGMTTVYGEDGPAIPETNTEVTPNLVLSRRTTERDGYIALQPADGELNEEQAKRARKPGGGIL